MGFIATVTFDLHGATPEKYEAFYKALAVAKWKKTEAASTTVVATFKDGVGYEAVVRITRIDFSRTAKEVGVEYSGELAVGYPPVELS